MALILLGARLLLSLVFVVAGLAKLADLTGSRKAVAGFGVSPRLAGPLGTLLPFAELAVALALIPRATAWYAALGALLLLGTFVAGIGVNLARGRAPDCHCFGQLHSEPVGWPTLARNGALAAVAAFIMWWGQGDSGASAVGWLSALTVAERSSLAVSVAAFVLITGQSWLLVQLTRQNGRLLLRLDDLEARLPAGGAAPSAPAPGAAAPEGGLPIGMPAPTFALDTLHGETLTLDALRVAGKPTLLVFSDPSCGPCNALLDDLGRWQREHMRKLTLAVVSRGTPEVNRAKAAEHGLERVLLQQEREVAEAYQAYGTPSAVIVWPDGTVGSALAQGAAAIQALVARTAGAPIPLQMLPARAAQPNGNGQANGVAAVPAAPAGPQVGGPAPALSLPDLDGKMVDLATLRGRPTLVLFWNPGCSFCTQMLDDLRAWETKPPKGAPQLLVVSTGDVEANRALGLRAPVVLDQGFSAGQSFGARGTPAAVLVDAQGKIGSGVAVGATAVLALAHGDTTPSLTP